MNYKKMMMYAGIGLLVIVLLVVSWNILRGSNKNTETFSGIENGSGSGSDYQLLFFYANWCPHCKVAKPEWEKLKAELDGKKVNGQTVKFMEYDCTEPSPEIEATMDKYNVSSYPTILLESPGGQVTPFENKPTKDSIVNFLNTNVK
jgi:thiol-disulfide isomerase/thioredoxin